MQVLFVSLHNEIRGKLAEALFKKNNRFTHGYASSAAIIPGGSPPATLMSFARSKHVSLSTSRNYVTVNNLQGYDLVVLVGTDISKSLFAHVPTCPPIIQWRISKLSDTEPETLEQLHADLQKNIKKLLRKMGQLEDTFVNAQEIIKELLQKATLEPIHNAAYKTLGVEDMQLHDFIDTHEGNSTLSLDLWRTGYQEARLIAVSIANPKDIHDSLYETWLRQSSDPKINDVIIKRIVFPQDPEGAKIRPWIREKNALLRRAGWLLASYISGQDEEILDHQTLGSLLERTIERDPPVVLEAITRYLKTIATVNKNAQNLLSRHATRLNLGPYDIYR